MNLIETIDLFLNHCRIERNLSPLTITAYTKDLSQFRFLLGAEAEGLLLQDIDKDTIRSYLGKMSPLYKPRSMKRKVATLKSLFTFLEREDYIQASPFRKLRLRYDSAKNLPRTIPVSSLKSLLQAAYATRNECSRGTRSYREVTRDIAVVELLFSTGVRVSELCSLTLRQVDIKNRLIQVVGKGKRERAIPLCSSHALAALAEYVDCYADYLLPSEPFFLNRDKRPLSDQSVRAIVHKYSQSAGLSLRVTPHMFRHTVATLLLENGVDIRNIQALLGHSSLAVTEIYTHVSLSSQRKVLERSHPREGLGVEESYR